MPSSNQATESKRRALLKQVMDEHDENLLTERAINFIKKVEHRLQRGAQQIQQVSADKTDHSSSNGVPANNPHASLSHDMPPLEAASTSFASAFSAESLDLGSSSALDVATMSSEFLNGLEDGDDKRRQYDKITRLRMARRYEESRKSTAKGSRRSEHSDMSQRKQMMKNLGI